MEFKNENLELCRECGGKCCLKCGCDYSAKDFKDLSYNGILEELSKGDKSIVVAFIDAYKTSSGKCVLNPLLYVRSRGENRDIIDLVSIKTRCSQLTETGCKYDYEHRPSGGKNLKPVKNEGCEPVIQPIEIVKTWEPYQKQLMRIVKRYTGKSLEQKIREDVENFFFDMLVGDFEGISPYEIEDLREFVPILALAYPDELIKADARCLKDEINVLAKKRTKNEETL